MIPPATPEDLEETVRLVEKTGQRVLARHVDVRDLAGLQAFAADTVAVSSGGSTWSSPTPGSSGWATPGSSSRRAVAAMIDVNLTGVFHTVRATVPHLIRQGQGGSIVLISSSAGLKGQPFTLALHGGQARRGRHLPGPRQRARRVRHPRNSIHPAGVETAMGECPGLIDMIAAKAETLGPVFMSTRPTRSMPPEDISGTVAYPASTTPARSPAPRSPSTSARRTADA